MCCLFGLIDYGRRLSGRQRSRIVATLARQSEDRGIDAAGIAYNAGGQLQIRKGPGPAHTLRLSVPNDAAVVLGHTRMTTQGSAQKNRNNHPFAGKVPGSRFALAHNGVLWNDQLLRRSRNLPDTRIETDSYVAVQLIEQQKALTPASLKTMAEAVEGSFVFTLLDEMDNLYFVKGDNPLCLLHFPRLKLYFYASTREILQNAVRHTWLAGEKGREIPVQGGDILRIDRAGRRWTDHFEMPEPLPLFYGNWRSPRRRGQEPEWYWEALKGVAASCGYGPEDLEALRRQGYTTDEMEEMLYECGLW